MTYRDDSALRVENDRLRARPRRWTVHVPGVGAGIGTTIGLALGVALGHRTPAGAVLTWLVGAALWALLFVRRVPAEGGR